MSNSNILIIGAGTWGCSIALELARRGHTDITVLDGSDFPSAISAGNDVNKIAEEAPPPSSSDSDHDYFWHTMASLSMSKWHHDPLFSPFYHDTGFIIAAASPSAYESCLSYQASETDTLTPLNSASDFHATMPAGVLTGPFPNWRGFWKKQGAGWVQASAVLVAMHAEAVRLGVRFITHTSYGRVESLIYSATHDTLLGARTSDSISHYANTTILAAGASSPQLLDFSSQLRPTAWTLAHIPLTKEEAQLYSNLPVLYCVDRGFFIEPSPTPTATSESTSYELKLCDEHPGYINPTPSPFPPHTLSSTPFARHAIPREAESRMRTFLRETMPHLADRPFSFARICWDADTPDRMFLIDRHPNIKNLVVAVGGSGNGFMMCPGVGGVVADLVEGKTEGGLVDERVSKMLKWRPVQGERDLWDAQGRYGAEGRVMDFRTVEDWTGVCGV